MSWDNFTKNFWRKKPCVVNGLKTTLVNTNECFDAVKILKELGPDFISRHAPRFIGQDNKQDDFYSLDMTKTSSIKELLLQEKYESTLIINNVQALSSSMFLNSLEFLNELYCHIKRPHGGALLDLFAGSHKISRLDLHKDEQDVFTFVVEGKRTFYLWPFEYFKDISSCSDFGEQRSFGLDGYDFSKDLENAIVIEAEVGDVVYWPASYWHVAQLPRDCSFSLTLGLGLFDQNVDPFLLAKRAQTHLYDEGKNTSFCLSDSINFLHDSLENNLFLNQLMIEQEKWKSAMGFTYIPKPIKKSDHQGNSVVSAWSFSPLFLKEMNNMYYLFWGGQEFRFEKKPYVFNLVNFLNRSSYTYEEIVKKSSENKNEELEVIKILFILIQCGAISVDQKSGEL